MTAVSPIFVTWLLTKISGIPHLERNADKKWGTSPAYLLVLLFFVLVFLCSFMFKSLVI